MADSRSTHKTGICCEIQQKVESWEDEDKPVGPNRTDGMNLFTYHPQLKILLVKLRTKENREGARTWRCDNDEDA